LNLRAGDQQKPAYLNLNPNAVVPTLVDSGAVILEIQSRVKTILASF
jgi:glutathione S-transferase